MSALTFDPWAILKRRAEDATPAKPANPANPIAESPQGLAEFAGLARGASPLLKTTTQPGTPPPVVATELNDAADDPPLPPTTPLPAVPLAEKVEAMAEALMANPAHHGITNREKAMEYFRANALTRLTATSDPLARGLLLGWERHRTGQPVRSKPPGR